MNRKQLIGLSHAVYAIALWTYFPRTLEESRNSSAATFIGSFASLFSIIAPFYKSFSERYMDRFSTDDTIYDHLYKIYFWSLGIGGAAANIMAFVNDDNKDRFLPIANLTAGVISAPFALYWFSSVIWHFYQDIRSYHCPTTGGDDTPAARLV